MCLSSGLYVTIRAIKSNKVMREDLLDLDTYWLCHDRIDHPSHDMMIRLQQTSHGHLRETRTETVLCEGYENTHYVFT